MKILALILSLSLLVATHELGHLFFAKLFKTRVRRYYIFFNWKFSILKAKKFDGKWHFLFFNTETPKEWEEKEPDNTLWGLGWIPLGGYCDIAGMIDETKGKDELESEPQPWEYRSKPAWQRLCIIGGGVFVNFISALLIYTCIFAHWGKDELSMRNASLGYEYHQILIDEGLQDGDMIWSIDGEEMLDIYATQQKLLLDKPKSLTVRRTITLVDSAMAEGDSVARAINLRDTAIYVDIALSDSLQERIMRENPKMLMAVRLPFVANDFLSGSPAKEAGMMVNDSLVSINGKSTPTFSEITETLQDHKGETVQLGVWREGEYLELTCKLGNDGKMGVYNKGPLNVFAVNHTDYSFFQAIPVGIKYGCQTLVSYVSSLKLLFAKGGAQNLGGFGTLGSLFPNEWDWFRFWDITALLAVILAFMNIIPIPGLDGGHIIFTLWEMVTRKKPSEKFLEVAQNIGMILLLALMVLANGNDLMRWLKHLF